MSIDNQPNKSEILTDSHEADRKKTNYFAKVGLRALDAMHLHKDQGLWERVDGKRDWGNVSEHCLVEAARVEVFADLLELPADLKKDLTKAAAVHDFYKKAEVAKLRANGTSWEAYADAQVEAKAIMDASPLNERTIYLATAVGHETLGEAETLLAKPTLDPTETAWLVMHYVDDYTIDAKPAAPAVNEGGMIKNDLRRRMDRNREQAQPGAKYHNIHLSGVEHLGELTFDAQERIGLLVEARIAQLISEATGQEIAPTSLPEYIDHELADKIAQS